MAQSIDLREERGSKKAAVSKKAAQMSAGDLALERLLQNAQYELEQDPYRGMLSLGKSPWSQCQFVADMDESSLSSATRKVFGTCHCTCPSLVRWTEQHETEQNKRKKRKRNKTSAESENVLGHRPVDPDYSCACDYNPLCLGSLGGIMDELLEQAARQVHDTEDLCSIDSKSQAARQCSIDSKSQAARQVHDTEDRCSIDSKSQGSPNEVIALDDGSVISVEAKRSKPNPHIPLNVSYTSDEDSSVEPGKHRPSQVYKKEITVEHMELDPAKEDAVYSTVTKEEIKQVRKICEIDLSPIRSYVEGTILSQLGNGVALSYETYIAELRKWHDSLAFSNPLLTTMPSNDSDKLNIAIPPGIKNLGATCYLNTQFQCLARMTAFLNGIFSWTPSGENHQMNSVLSTMQLLFARMAHGSEATLTTQEFSTAIGLETDEMQDPNEFARLLFERMHESFQQCVCQGEKEDLSQLLPKLFHGVTTYETVCLTCRNVTERSEGFMDVNLPIVHPSESPRKKSGQLKITDSFAGDNTDDTNVQYCLDRYICAEELSGDNQYSCECCGTKRDALRTINFRELPPLLNVQLSRYVFDRKKLAKKKLTDKVLLPCVLTVPMKGKDVDTRYLLCAVMKHRGNSAYQGHYIAEAMDWQSGTWFEFNDEAVTVLESPSCSYLPEELENIDKMKVKGSQDAYNMYYVEENFLAKCASNFLTTWDQRDQTNVLAKVANEREHRYSMITEMCLNDANMAFRLMRRRLGLTKRLSGELSTQTGSILFNRHPLASGVETGVVQSQAPVWVDGNILRRFLSCDKTDVSSTISTSGPLLKHKHLLCEHGVGLHPRVARNGKLLPRPLYDALVSLMLGERRMINGEDESEGSEVNTQVYEDVVNDCIITPNHNMYCKDCADSYKHTIRKKIDMLCRLRQLCNELDSKVKMTLEIKDDSSADSETNETVFLVSQKFVTKFRLHVSNIIKAAGATELQSLGRNQGSKKVDTYCAGLDVVDLSEFDPNVIAVNDCSYSSDDLDRFVNGSITCEHGKCNSPHSRTVRRVSGDVWRQLVSLFPNAICLEIGKEISNSEVRCELCEDEETKDAAFAGKLREWSAAATSSPLLYEIAKGKRTAQDISFKLLDMDTDDETMDGGPANDVILVHSKDVESWRAALKAVKKHTGKTTSALTELLIDHLFSDPKGSSEPDKGIQNVFGKLFCSMGSLSCGDHSLPLERAVFKPGVDTKDPCITLFNSFVEALTPAEYAALIGSIYDLGMLLFPVQSGAEATESVEDIFESSSQHVTRTMLQHLQRNRHPRVQSPLRPIGHDSSSLDFDTLLKCHYSSGICRDVDCNREFEVENARYVSPEKTDQHKSNHVDLVNETAGQSEQTVEAKSEETFPLRAFQIDPKAEVDTVITSILGLSGPDAGANRKTTSVRRSTRRRKSTYPSGNVLREDFLEICSHYNIAAVRLFLYEKYPGFSVDRDLTLVIPGTCNHVDMTMEETVMDSQSDVDFIATDLEYSWNEKSLEEIVASTCKEMDLAPPPSLKEIFLCWKDEISEGKKKGPKTSGDDTPIPNESLMDALLEMTNVSSAQDTPSAGDKKKSTRRAERGFRGTLLHSIAAPNPHESEKSNDAPNSDGSEKSDEKTPEKSEKENQAHHVDVAAQDVEKQSVVVVDNSDDEKSVHQAGKRKRKATAPDDESNSILVLHTSLNGEKEGGTRHLRSTIVDPKEEVIINNLIDALARESGTNSSAALSRCREAARWAISENSEDTEFAILTDVALAKYFEESPM